MQYTPTPHNTPSPPLANSGQNSASLIYVLTNADLQYRGVLEALNAGTFMQFAHNLGRRNRWSQRELIRAYAGGRKWFGPGRKKQPLEYPPELVENGQSSSVIPYKVTISAREVAGEGSLWLSNLIRDFEHLAEYPYSFIIQGEPTAYAWEQSEAGGVTRPMKCRKTGNEQYRDRPVRLLLVDLDDVQLPPDIDSTSDAALRWVVENNLPPYLHNAAIGWQFSSSAGTKLGLFSGHLFFVLDRPLPLSRIKKWASSWNAIEAQDFGYREVSKPIDPAALRCVQPIYIAHPVFAVPEEDPFRGRSRWGFRDGGVVRADDLEATIREKEQAANRHRTEVRKNYAHLPPKKRAELLGDITDWRAAFEMIGDHLHDPITSGTFLFVQQYGEEARGMAGWLEQEARAIWKQKVASGERVPDGTDEPNLSNIPNDIETLLSPEKRTFKKTGEPWGRAIARITSGKDYEGTGGPYCFADLIWTAYAPAFTSREFKPVHAAIQEALEAREASGSPLNEAQRIDLALVQKKAEEEYETTRSKAVLGRQLSDKYRRTTVSGLKDIPIYQDGITFVRATHGLGKTEVLGKAAVAMSSNPVHLGPRQSIAADVANRLGLGLYSDGLAQVVFRDLIPNKAHEKGMAMCVLSLCANHLWDAVKDTDYLIIDEIKSLIPMLFNPSLGQKGTQQKNVERFIGLLRAAKRVLILDADLSDHEVDMVLSMAQRADYRIYEVPSDMRDFTFNRIGYDDFTKAEPPGLAEGKRVLVYSESVNLTKKCPWIKKYLDSGEGLLLSRDTKEEEIQKAVLADPNAALKGHTYKLIVLTPVVDTGWSVTADIADEVYFVSHGVLPPEGQLQMMRRYRRAREINLVFGNRIFPPLITAQDEAAAYASLLDWAGVRRDGPGFAEGDWYSNVSTWQKETSDGRRRLGDQGLVSILKAEKARLTWLQDASEPEPSVDRVWRKVMKGLEEVATQEDAAKLAAGNGAWREKRERFCQYFDLPRDTNLSVTMVMAGKKHTVRKVKLVRDVFSEDEALPGEDFCGEEPGVARDKRRSKVKLLRDGLAAIGRSHLSPGSLLQPLDAHDMAKLDGYVRGRWRELFATKLIRTKMVRIDGGAVEISEKATPARITKLFFAAMGIELESNGKKRAQLKYSVPAEYLDAWLQLAGLRELDREAPVPDWTSWGTKLGRLARGVFEKYYCLPLDTQSLVKLLGVSKSHSARTRSALVDNLPPHLHLYDIDGIQVVSKARQHPANVRWFLSRMARFEGE